MTKEEKSLLYCAIYIKNYKETVNGSIIEKSDSSNLNILRLVHVIIAILLHPLFQASAI